MGADETSWVRLFVVSLSAAVAPHQLSWQSRKRRWTGRSGIRTQRNMRGSRESMRMFWNAHWVSHCLQASSIKDGSMFLDKLLPSSLLQRLHNLPLDVYTMFSLLTCPLRDMCEINTWNKRVKRKAETGQLLEVLQIWQTPHYRA